MTPQDRYRAADRVARDALDVDVLADEVRDAVRSDEMMLYLASAAHDLGLSLIVDEQGTDAVAPDVDETLDDVEDLAHWRARNLAQRARDGRVEA